jgi:hypothetical protein
MVFAWVEDRLSVSVKQEITAWLKAACNFAERQTLSFSLLRFHIELFGDKQLSVKCVVRTILFSLTSFLLVFLPYIIAFPLYMPKLPIAIDGFKLHDDAHSLNNLCLHHLYYLCFRSIFLASLLQESLQR